MSRLSELIGIESPKNNITAIKILSKYKSGPLIIHDDEFCGIEIEVENITKYPEEFKGIWTMKADGSLRNNGQEFVSPPIRGDQLSKALTLFYNYLQTEATFSPRTSIHVHLNVLDNTIDLISSIILLYLVFERSLYRFIGHDRDKSVFCVPMQDTARVANLFHDFKFQLEQRGAIQGNDTRYTGLNTASLHNFGTLEFRQLHGTRDLDLVCNWINLLTSLKKYVLNNQINFIKSILDLNTNSQYLQFAELVFGSQIKLFNPLYIPEDMEAGVRAVKFGVLSSAFKKALVSEKAVNVSKWLESTKQPSQQVRYELRPEDELVEIRPFRFEPVAAVAVPPDRALDNAQWAIQDANMRNNQEMVEVFQQFVGRNR